MAVKKVSKREDKSIEFILSKEQREKKNLKETCGIVTKGLVYVSLEFQKERRKEMKEEKYLKKLWSRTFQIWGQT